MRSSLRIKLLGAFLVLVVIAGAGTLIAIERTLADDLVAQLDHRLESQAQGVAAWMATAGHPDRLAPRLGQATGARVTIIGADGLIQGDSVEPTLVGRPIGDAREVSLARRGEVGRATRRLRDNEEDQYLVAVLADFNRVIRLAVPLDDIHDTRDAMRYRLLVGGAFGFLAVVLLGWISIRALTKPLQSMTYTAERLARGDYDATAPTDGGGELGVLANAMNHMAAEVKSRVTELTQQRDVLSVVFGGLVEGVVVVDRKGRIVFVNDAARPLLQFDDDTVTPLHDQTDALPSAIQPLVERALAGEPADAELDLVGRAVRASARPLDKHGGEGDLGAIVVLYDVTRMRALEAVRREFLSNAAHELRTPVTSIGGYAETLLSAPVDPATTKEFLQTIQRNSQRITSIISDLVLLDTLGGRAKVVGDRLPIPLGVVVSDAARTAKGVKPSAQIEIDVPADLDVLATRDGLDHVVQNLIDNALKYGGDTPVHVRAERVDSHVRLSVRDHGPGIPKGQEKRIFERFYRIDYGRSRDAGGSGLGLAIVQSQIEALGGRVWVEHAEPGARFVVELDAAT